MVDLANFLNMCGADVRGAGTDVIKVRGVEQMHGCTYSIIPDQIEAGSYMVAAAATGGDVLVKNVTPKHLEPITAKLRRAGIEVEEFDDAVRVRRTGDILPLKINTMPTRLPHRYAAPDGRSAQRGKGDFHRHRERVG